MSPKVHILGIDIGGTGVKGAPVDVRSGVLTELRYREITPQPSTPDAVADTVNKVIKHFDWKGPVGCGLPGVVKQGRVRTAANIAEQWLDCNAQELFEQATGCPFVVINDADAAGYAEMHFGAGQGRQGLVIVVTLGTGIGTALFIDGHLVPNTELGHIESNGVEAELRASELARKNEGLSWKKWARRVDKYLHDLQRYFWPDLFIIGGGASNKSEKFLPHLTVPVPLLVAELRNEAGIVGAALAYQSKGS
jgi:polyphosphate glucokinase